MSKIFGFLILSVTSVLVSCDKDQEDAAPICEVSATVRDLSGLDGCGFVFELEDGTRLEPLRTIYCGSVLNPSDIKPDPIHAFEFVAGKKVKISYNIMSEITTACMAGTPAKITCITEDGWEEPQQ